VEVNGIEEALKRAQDDGCSIFVFRPISEHKKGNFFKLLSSSGSMKGIAWAHNTPDIFTLNKLYKNENLSCFLCVSQEQYDRLRDHPIIYKSACIFNGFEVSNFVPAERVEKQGNKVAYIGSLVPAKGFHWLAKAWPSVLKEKPDAKLIVMGSGKLYDRNATMGKWGIAQESYEAKHIRPYLAGADGKPHPSVNFMGLLGAEKIEIMQNVDIGVINPSGVSENCPGSALEFQAAGTPIVSSAKRGILDTVVHEKTGLLGVSIYDLAINIIRLLNDRERSMNYGENGIKFVQGKFNWPKIAEEWINLFINIRNNKSFLVKDITQNPSTDLKLIREQIRRAKEDIGVKGMWFSIHSIHGIFKNSVKVFKQFYSKF
jgi:glycosyltransferase involved in cell wall biosynthesis